MTGKKRKQPTTRKPNAGKPKDPPKSAPTTSVRPAAAKTKGKQQPPQAPKPLTPAARVTKMRTDADTALKAVFGKSVERDDDDVITNDVIADVVFDRDEVHRLAEALANEVNDLPNNLKDNLNRLAEREARVKRALDDLQEQLEISRQPTGRIKEIKRLATRTGDGIVVETDPLTSGLWLLLQAEIAKPKPVAPPGHHVLVDTRLTAIDRIVTEIKARLGNVTAIVTAINGRPGALPTKAIPATLLTAVNRGGLDMHERVVVLRSGVEQEPDPVKLTALLVAADVPAEVPKLMRDAAAVGAVLLDVLTTCRATAPQGQPALQGQAALAGNTELAGKLLKTISDSGRNADYFLSGAGGKSLADLRHAANAGAPVWAGSKAAAVSFGPVDQPVTLDHIRGIAEQLPPPGQNALLPLPNGEVRDRYVGARHFGNFGNEGGMILPSRVGPAGPAIQYTEFDIRPFTTKDMRGTERAVVGTDGNKYYTDDHYKTFGRLP